MLVMVIERFKNGDAGPIAERFRASGRMLPEGVTYIDSWVDPVAARCFQLMETPAIADLTPWIAFWSDLADLEIVPVLTSAAFWQARDEAETRATTSTTIANREATRREWDSNPRSP